MDLIPEKIEAKICLWSTVVVFDLGCLDGIIAVMVEEGSSNAFPHQEIGLPRKLPNELRWTLRHTLAGKLETYYNAAYPDSFDPDLSESDRLLAEHAKASARYNYLILRSVVEAGDKMKVEANALAGVFTVGMGDSFDADLFIDSFSQVGRHVEELVEKNG